MTKWRYREVYIKASELVSRLDELGADGWELIHVVLASGPYAGSHRVLLKRPVEERSSVKIAVEVAKPVVSEEDKLAFEKAMRESTRRKK
jgi:hypothetical protein